MGQGYKAPSLSDGCLISCLQTMVADDPRRRKVPMAAQHHAAIWRRKQSLVPSLAIRNSALVNTSVYVSSSLDFRRLFPLTTILGRSTRDAAHRQVAR